MANISHHDKWSAMLEELLHSNDIPMYIPIRLLGLSKTWKRPKSGIQTSDVCVYKVLK